jgi:hypothetical protein
MFRWKDGTTGAQVDAIEAALRGLPDEIPELRDYHFGRDLGLVPTSLDFCVVADLDDEPSWARYRDHPTHRRILDELITPVTESRFALQYEIS